MLFNGNSGSGSILPYSNPSLMARGNCSQYQNVQAFRLFSYWPLTQASTESNTNNYQGFTPQDNAGGSSDVAIHGGVTPDCGPIIGDSALHFDGSTGYLQGTTGGASPTGNGARSETFWISVTNFNSIIRAFTYGSVSTPNFYNCYINSSPTGVTGQVVATPGLSDASDQTYVSSGTPMVANIPYHVGIVYDGTNLSNTKVFLNGVQQTVSNNAADVLNTTASQPYCFNAAAGGSFIGGACSIWGARHYDRVLSAADVFDIYAAGIANKEAIYSPATELPILTVPGVQLTTGNVDTLKRNIANQNVTFSMISQSNGSPLTNLTIHVFVTKDNAPQTAGAGTVTEKGSGQYDYTPTQAETNAVDVGFLFTASNAVPYNMDFHTDVVDTNSFQQTDIEALHAITLSPSNLGISTQAICWGTVGNGSTTTSIVVSSLNNPSSLTTGGQLTGRTLLFLGNSTTLGLQSSYASITASTTGATPTLTVTPLPATPVSGDTFVLL